MPPYTDAGPPLCNGPAPHFIYLTHTALSDQNTSEGKGEGGSGVLTTGWLSDMKIFVSYEDFREPFHVSPDQTVGAVKQMVTKYFLLQLANDKDVQQELELSYAGASLQDGWALGDVGVSPGAVLRCLIKNKPPPAIQVFNVVTQETFSVIEPTPLLSTTVARLKTIISLHVGLPVSTFRLSTALGVELYDCNLLSDYDIELGSTLQLDTWDGWVEFIQGCVRGHILAIQCHLSKEKVVMRFQLRVALSIAAFMGHLELADWLLQRRARPERPVGVHPYRLWCHKTSHQDSSKCPIHIAAERGQLLILKLFVSNNPVTLATRDRCGRCPLQIALQHRHKMCVCYIVSKLYSVMSLPKLCVSMRVYLQIKAWVKVGQTKAAFKRAHAPRASIKSRAGDTVLVDGFTESKMSSKPVRDETKVPRKIGAKILTPLTGSRLLSGRPLEGDKQQLQSLCPADNAVSNKMQRQRINCRKRGVDVFSGESKDDRDRDSPGGRAWLPPITFGTNPRQLNLHAQEKPLMLNNVHGSGDRTHKENAIYWLAISSTFTEKSWLQQLGVARSLARRCVQRMD
ncbi:protein ANKUB1-like isoform X2 [Gadus macrocephalus]|uniref:protein ANKUB1-like isoform X2 n=1 Tax=Gadus macrocephalus TaxID=80720 RepID=UPI0028CBB1C1|nr:protein ANKUB1-like isoform X2 [Gadus macrocephalus]